MATFQRPIPLASFPTPKITYGCPTLDRMFGGGIPIGSITEFVGESGCGKTQLMLQIALNTQLPEVLGGQAGRSLYLNADLAFPIKRLAQIASNNPFFDGFPMDRVFVKSIECVDDLLQILAGLETYLEAENIKFIVVDSITSLFRGAFANTGASLRERQNIFFKISSKLKYYAVKFKLAVVVTNQVTGVIDGNDQVRMGNLPSITTSGRTVVPALNISWANCVNTRFVIVKLAAEVQVKDDAHPSSSASTESTRRRLHVVFAPHIGNVSCEIDINSDGVFGIAS